jgi:hypothetical protein
MSAITGDATSESSSEGDSINVTAALKYRDTCAVMSRDDETQRCETDAIYRMLSERPTSSDAVADAAGRDAEFDRTQMEAASLQLQVLSSSQLSDSGRYCTSEGTLPFVFNCNSVFYSVAQVPSDTSTLGNLATPRRRRRAIKVSRWWARVGCLGHWHLAMRKQLPFLLEPEFSIMLRAGDKGDEVLHLQDFGWKTHGCGHNIRTETLIRRHNCHRTAILDATNAQLCQMVDSHFDLVYSMTNNRHGFLGSPATLCRALIHAMLQLERARCRHAAFSPRCLVRLFDL